MKIEISYPICGKDIEYYKKHSYHIEMINRKSYTKWGNNVYLSFGIGDKEDGGIGYVVKKHYIIPLSPYAFYISCIFPTLKMEKD